MAKEIRTQCPTCMGMKIIKGVCETSQEWSGSADNDEMECTPDEICPTCNGTGYVIEIVED